jgi:REP element-mobilizing transposase RayT
MMKKLFMDRYRIESSRKNNHDYSAPGIYFVTINTDAQIHWFGHITNGIMNLSPIGEIVKEEWLKSELLRENIKLDEFVIMPDHLHGIIIIKFLSVETSRWDVSKYERDVFTGKRNIFFCEMDVSTCKRNISCCEKDISSCKVSSDNVLSRNNDVFNYNSKNKNKLLKPNSIGSIIGQFKSICTKRIHKRGFKYFKWQSRFHDHIIMSKEELHRYRFYIRSNPKKG